MSHADPAEPSGALTTDGSKPDLVRGISLTQATTLNMIDMIGVGPFITLPLIIAAAGGPQAMLGWILGAFFALCDGLVWAELGASMPEAGGSYQYLKQSYGPELPRTPVLVPLHLAAFVQCAVVDRIGMHRPIPLCGIPLARPGADTLRRCLPPSHSADRHA